VKLSQYQVAQSRMWHFTDHKIINKVKFNSGCLKE